MSTRSATIATSSLIHAPPLPIEYMAEMPAATPQTVTSVDPVQGELFGVEIL